MFLVGVGVAAFSLSLSKLGDAIWGVPKCSKWKRRRFPKEQLILASKKLVHYTAFGVSLRYALFSVVNLISKRLQKIRGHCYTLSFLLLKSLNGLSINGPVTGERPIFAFWPSEEKTNSSTEDAALLSFKRCSDLEVLSWSQIRIFLHNEWTAVEIRPKFKKEFFHKCQVPVILQKDCCHYLTRLTFFFWNISGNRRNAPHIKCAPLFDVCALTSSTTRLPR